MALIPAAPFQALVGFSVGTDEYTPALAQVEFQATRASSTFTDITGAPTQLAGKSGYVLAINLAQDWEEEDSLAHYLFTHDGEDATVTLGVPGGEWDATVICGAPNIGGTGSAPATSQLTLPVRGLPVWTAEV